MKKLVLSVDRKTILVFLIFDINPVHRLLIVQKMFLK